MEIAYVEMEGLIGKSPINGGFNGKIIYNAGFSS
jgi:hypothetical protein